MNVFSSKPWSVLRNMLRNILSLSHIKSKSNYILESLFYYLLPMALHKDARQTSMKMFICFVPARLNFLLATLLNRKFSCLKKRKRTQQLPKLLAQHCWPNNVGSCCVRFQEAKSLTGFKHCATTCNRVCKRTQHVPSNNVASICT